MRIGQQTVVGDTKYTFNLPSGVNNLVVFDVHNDSPYNMGISFGHDTSITNCDYYTSPHGVLTGIVPPSIDKRSIGGVRWNGIIYVYTETPVGGGGTTDLSTAPARSITVIGYQAGYQPQGQVALNRMQTTANTVDTNAMTSSTTSVTNDDNPSGTTFIEAKVSGNNTGSNIVVENSGDAAFKQWVGSVLTTLFQTISAQTAPSASVKLAAAGLLVEVLGQLKVDASLEVAGDILIDQGSGLHIIDNSAVDNKVLYIDAFNQLAFQTPSSNVVAFYDSSGNALMYVQVEGSGGLQLGPGIFLNGTNNANTAHANLVGVDSAGNTAFQAFPDTNKIVIYDKNGVACFAFAPATKSLQIADSGNVLRDVLYVNTGAGETYWQAIGTGKIRIKKNDGTDLFSIDSSGNVRPKGTITASVTP